MVVCNEMLNARVRDDVAARKVQISDTAASSSETRKGSVRDIVAIIKVQRGASNREIHQPFVRDAVAMPYDKYFEISTFSQTR